MLWLCLYFPRIAVEAFSTSKHTAVAVTDKNRIHTANIAASEQGIQAEQSLVTAWALCEDLKLHPRDLQKEVSLINKLASHCLKYTPYLCIPSQNQLLLNLSGCLTVHGGWSNLLNCIQRDELLTPLTYHLGVGYTPESAALLSQLTNEDSTLYVQQGQVQTAEINRLLAKYPIGQLNIDSKIKARLTNVGVSNLGSAKQLPSHALGRRQGFAFSQYLSQIYGYASDVRRYYTQAVEFYESSYSLQESSKVSELEPAIRHQLKLLSQFLIQHQMHALELRWCFKHDKGYQHRLFVGVESAGNQLESHMKLSLLALEKSPLKQAINELSLRSVHRPMRQLCSEDLFPDTTQKTLDESLIDILKARLSSHQISKVRHISGHRPEALQSEFKLPESHQGLRPSWLLKCPRQIFKHQQCFSYNDQTLSLVQGPERIDSEWWGVRSQRDYFIAKSNHGETYWIYNDLNHGRWFIHGIFG